MLKFKIYEYNLHLFLLEFHIEISIRLTVYSPKVNHKNAYNTFLHYRIIDFVILSKLISHLYEKLANDSKM